MGGKGEGGGEKVGKQSNHGAVSTGQVQAMAAKSDMGSKMMWLCECGGIPR